MDENNKFKNITAIKPETYKDFGDDPDAKRKEQLKSEEHRTKVLVHWIFRILIVSAVIFLLVLFFVILPISEMYFKYYSFWYPFHRWSVAFLSTAGTAVIALLTLAVSDLLKRVFDHLKNRAYIKD